MCDKTITYGKTTKESSVIYGIYEFLKHRVYRNDHIQWRYKIYVVPYLFCCCYAVEKFGETNLLRKKIIVLLKKSIEK